MKNKIIISLIFIVPIIIYLILLAFNPEISIEEAVNAKTNLPKILVFSTPMCSECKKLAPIIDKSKSKYENRVEIIKINATESQYGKIVRKHQIYVVPTIVYMDKDDNVVQRTEGLMTEEQFDKFVKALLTE